MLRGASNACPFFLNSCPFFDHKWNDETDQIDETLGVALKHDLETKNYPLQLLELILLIW